MTGLMSVVFTEFVDLVASCITLRQLSIFYLLQYTSPTVSLQLESYVILLALINASINNMSSKYK